MSLTSIFATPFWHYNVSPVNSAYEWALNYERNNQGSFRSNRGGYQSKSMVWDEFMYKDHISNILKQDDYFSDYEIISWWLNINRKGHYNLPHDHGDSCLSGTWYITDNQKLLYLTDPNLLTRGALYEDIFPSIMGYELSNKCIEATAGDLILFPGDVTHGVEENPLDTPRISVSFNMKKPSILRKKEVRIRENAHIHKSLK